MTPRDAEPFEAALRHSFKVLLADGCEGKELSRRLHDISSNFGREGMLLGRRTLFTHRVRDGGTCMPFGARDYQHPGENALLCSDFIPVEDVRVYHYHVGEEPPPAEAAQPAAATAAAPAAAPAAAAAPAVPQGAVPAGSKWSVVRRASPDWYRAPVAPVDRTSGTAVTV